MVQVCELVVVVCCPGLLFNNGLCAKQGVGRASSRGNKKGGKSEGQPREAGSGCCRIPAPGSLRGPPRHQVRCLTALLHLHNSHYKGVDHM